MLKEFQELLGSEKFIVSAVHLLPLPGCAYYDREGGMKKIIARAKRDAHILADNGVHAFLFTNEADMPYLFRLPQEGVAAFTAIVQEVMGEIDLPFGINVLVDAGAAFNIAYATGASFIRGLFASVYVSDNGIIENQGANVFRMRDNLGAKKPYFIHNLASPIGMPVVKRTGLEEAHSLASHVWVDAYTLPSSDLDMFRQVKEAYPEMPLFVGTGTNHKNLPDLLKYADGTIVATCLHEDGKLLNPVDEQRTKDFMKVFAAIGK